MSNISLRLSRTFNTTRRPLTAASAALVSAVRLIILAAEPARQRARRASDEATFNTILAAVVADLTHRSLQTDGEGWIKVSRSGRLLGRGDPILAKPLPKLLDKMAGAGLIEQDIGFLNASTGRREQTRVRAAARLETLIAAHEVTFADLSAAPTPPEDMLKLNSAAKDGDWRGDTKTRLALPETPEVNRLQREMMTVNHIFARARIEVEPSAILSQRHGQPDVSDRCARRVFNGDLTRGGRLYGPFWIDMKKEDRLRAIMIDGERVAALDYGQLGPRVLYASAGIAPPEGDLYGIPGLETAQREGVKKLLNALMSSKRGLGRWPRGAKGFFPAGTSLSYAVDCVTDHHRPIVHTFGTSSWGPIQRAESDMIVSIILECDRRGFVVLPNHDGFIVPRSRAKEARAVMVKAFKERMKTDALIPVSEEIERGIIDDGPLTLLAA